MQPKSDSSRLTALEYVTIAGIATVWGVNNAAAMLATAVLPPMLTAALRFLIAALVLAPFIRPPFPRPRRLALLVLFAGPIHYGILYLGFSFAHDLSPMSVALQLWIPLVAVLSWLFLREPISPAALLGLVLAFVGVAVMMLDRHVFNDLPSVGFGLLAACAWAVATLVARRLPEVEPLKLQGLASVFAALTLGLASAGFERSRWADLARADWVVWSAILFGAIASTVVATVLLFKLVQRREAGRVTPYMLASPLVSMALGVAFFGDVITPQILVGALVCIGGVVAVAISERSRKTSPGEVAVEQAGSTS